LFVTHLESTADGSRLDARALQTVHGGKPLLVRYDLARIARALPRAALRERPSDLWRWRELVDGLIHECGAIVREGIALCPESAACLGVLERALRERWIDPGERTVLFNTGAAQKYVEAIAVELPALRKDAVDWDVLR
jgi:hypothetical protein